MELATTKRAGSRLRALGQVFARLFGAGHRPASHNARHDHRHSGARTDGSRGIADALPEDLLSQIDAGLEFVERQREVIERQLAERRYDREVLAEYAERLSADIAALEQSQARLDAISAELREAHWQLSRTPVATVSTHAPARHPGVE